MYGTSLESPTESKLIQYIILVLGFLLTVTSPVEILLAGFIINLRIYLELFFGPFLFLWSLGKIRERIQVESAVKFLSAIWGGLFFAVGLLGVINSVLRITLLGIHNNVITYLLLVYGHKSICKKFLYLKMVHLFRI